jgi:hypothetical protein
MRLSARPVTVRPDLATATVATARGAAGGRLAGAHPALFGIDLGSGLEAYIVRRSAAWRGSVARLVHLDFGRRLDRPFVRYVILC